MDAVSVACGVDNAPFNNLIYDGLFVFLVGLFDLFDDGSRFGVVGVCTESDATFQISISTQGHLSLLIHIMLDPRIFLQQREVLLHRVLVTRVRLLLVLLAVAQLLMHVLEDQVRLLGVVSQVLEVMMDFGMGLTLCTA